jgi:hypothetical protein
MMVEEFSRRLRLELTKLKNGVSELRGRALTSSSTRISLDSVRSPGQLPKAAQAIAAFESVPSRKRDMAE